MQIPVNIIKHSVLLLKLFKNPNAIPLFSTNVKRNKFENTEVLNISGFLENKLVTPSFINCSKVTKFAKIKKFKNRFFFNSSTGNVKK